MIECGEGAVVAVFIYIIVPNGVQSRPLYLSYVASVKEKLGNIDAWTAIFNDYAYERNKFIPTRRDAIIDFHAIRKDCGSQNKANVWKEVGGVMLKSMVHITSQSSSQGGKPLSDDVGEGIISSKCCRKNK